VTKNLKEEDGVSSAPTPGATCHYGSSNFELDLTGSLVDIRRCLLIVPLHIISDFSVMIGA